jgi:hypothetical protein
MPITELGRTGPLPRTAWSDRVRVLADASGVSSNGLGDLVETELARADGVLFTATPTEELDQISRWQRLSDAAWCGQVREIVASHNRMSTTQREFLACEVALALNISDSCAQDLVATALLAADAAGLVEAVEAGLLTVRHVHAVLRELAGAGLTSEEQHAVVTVALVRYTGETPADLGKLVARLVLTVHPAAAAAKESDATYRRRVRFRAVEDGQGLLIARGPLAQIEAMRAALAAGAGAVPHDRPDPDGEHSRTRDAIEFDLLHDLLVGGGGGGTGGGWTAAIVMTQNLVEGADDELAEIPGLGVVLPEPAREVLARATSVQRILVDEQGNVIDVSGLLPGPAAAATERDPLLWLRRLEQLPVTGIPVGRDGYRPGTRLRRFVEARDRSCTFPGCSRPAVRCDLDHRLCHPLGATDAHNLHALCRRHHRAKQALFVVIQLPNGTTRWITRGGWWFDRRPKAYSDRQPEGE